VSTAHFTSVIHPLRWYIVQAEAELLDLSCDSVRTPIACGILQASNVAAIGGKARWKITAADIAEFLARRRNVRPARRPARAKAPSGRGSDSVLLIAGLRDS